jgi:hypothetical protein
MAKARDCKDVIKPASYFIFMAEQRLSGIKGRFEDLSCIQYQRVLQGEFKSNKKSS